MVVIRMPEQQYPPVFLFHLWVQSGVPRLQGGNFENADFRLIEGKTFKRWNRLLFEVMFSVL